MTKVIQATQHDRPQQGEIILYQPDETVRLEVRLEDETVWLNRQQLAELFLKDQSVIARHIANVFHEGEVDEKSNMQILHNGFLHGWASTVKLCCMVLTMCSKSANRLMNLENRKTKPTSLTCVRG